MIKKRKVGEMGFTGIEVIIMLVIFLIILLGGIIFILVLKIHITGTLYIDYKEDKSTLSLLTLLSDRKDYRRLSLYSSGIPSLPGKFSREDVENEIKKDLDTIVESRCYILSNSNGELLSTDYGCTPMYNGYTIILLPFKTDKLNLKISEG